MYIYSQTPIHTHTKYSTKKKEKCSSFFLFFPFLLDILFLPLQNIYIYGYINELYFVYTVAVSCYTTLYYTVTEIIFKTIVLYSVVVPQQQQQTREDSYILQILIKYIL